MHRQTIDDFLFWNLRYIIILYSHTTIHSIRYTNHYSPLRYSFSPRSSCIFFLCQIIITAITAQDFNPTELNTAADGINSTFPVGSIDPNWLVAFGDNSGPVSDFIPSKVVGNCAPGYWIDSPDPNANWLSYDFDNPSATDCDHTIQGCLDLFFRREIILPMEGECGTPIIGHFCLGLDFYADNSVYRISVNGVEQYVYSLPDDPYNYYYGFQIPTSINLCIGWQSGTNVLLIHIKSCPSDQGFLAHVSSEFDNKYFASVIQDTSICSGQEFLGYDQSGVYYDTIVGLGGCDTIRELHLTIQPAPVTTKEIILCQDDSIMINDRFIFESGIYFDTLTTSNFCDSILLIEVKMANEDFLEEDLFVCDGNPVTLESPSQYTNWSTGEQSQSIQIDIPGTYWAFVEDINGCSYFDTINIKFGPRIFVPNAFSPNYDGTNDEFRVYFSDANFEHYTLSVFDRWGSLKFYSDNHYIGWNGEYKGELCSNGVYIYMITYTLPGCSKIIHTGDLTLFK